MRAREAQRLLRSLTDREDRRDCLTHVHDIPARPGRTEPFPTWVDPRIREHLEGEGIAQLWSHQAQAANLAHTGHHVVLATGTASGKSLGYVLPALTAIGQRERDPGAPRATVLYLAPTKALAADQMAAITAIGQGAGLRDARIATFDGDTPSEQRRWVRRHATFVLTNPDMLHFGILPGHDQWATFMRALRYVIVDECHAYRGVFGSHVALVLRRLRRIAAHYRADPTFIAASATTANPEVSASRLTGVEMRAVNEDGSARAAMTIGLWEPGTKTPPGAGSSGAAVSKPADHGSPRRQENQPPDADVLRRSATSEAGALLADVVAADVQTLVFTRSRRSAELVAATAKRLLSEQAASLGRADLARRASHIAAYRGGFLASERRELEAGLRSGQLRAIASTNALELGIDVSGLDAVMITGWPGTRASWWQQMGRAGRSHDADAGGLGLFIAREDPLDVYVVHHPETVFGAPVETTVCDPGNPYVLAPHLCAAAAELPIRDGEESLFGARGAEQLELLVQQGLLRRRPTGWYWTLMENAHELTDLRGSGAEPVRIVDRAHGTLIGTVDASSSHVHVHTGAVHVHQGRTYVVDELDVEQAVAFVHREDPLHTTHPQSVSTVRIRQVDDTWQWRAGVQLNFGTVDVSEQVTGYQVRDVYTQAVLAQHPLDLPVRTLTTKAVWFTIPLPRTVDAAIPNGELPGALHAAEHAMISLLPLLATCDRWDIGGLSTAQHEDTGEPTIFVYDGAPGGAGFARRGAEDAAAWVRATADLIAACGCAHGCPACVVSPKCGNGNEPLSKEHAHTLLGLLEPRE